MVAAEMVSTVRPPIVVDVVVYAWGGGRGTDGVQTHVGNDFLLAG